jgi:hypothetical protein
MLPLLQSSDSLITGSDELIRAEQELGRANANGAIQHLREQINRLPESCRLAAYYVVGLADASVADADRCRDGLLTLLTLPAAYGDSQPELAAAALYQAAIGLDKLKDEAGAAALRTELTAHYAGTRFERLARGKTGP